MSMRVGALSTQAAAQSRKRLSHAEQWHWASFAARRSGAMGVQDWAWSKFELTCRYLINRLN